MKPGGWWTSCGHVSWLITMPVLGWQSPPRYISANPLIRQLSGVYRRLNCRSLCAFPSMLPRVTLLCWTIQPSAASWSRRPVPHLRSTRAPRLLLWSSPSPSPSHSKAMVWRGMVSQCGEKMEASKSADLVATQAKWVQVVAVKPACFFFCLFLSKAIYSKICHRIRLVCHRLLELSTGWRTTPRAVRLPDCTRRRQLSLEMCPSMWSNSTPAVLFQLCFWYSVLTLDSVELDVWRGQDYLLCLQLMMGFC